MIRTPRLIAGRPRSSPVHARTFATMVRGPLFLCMCALFGSCAPEAQEQQGQGEWSTVPNDRATNFRILVRGDERRLIVFGHAGPTDTAGRYQIVADGQKADLGWTALSSGKQRIVLGSTTHVPYVGALSAWDVIAGIAHGDQVRDTAFQRRLRDGAVQEMANGDGIDRERLVAIAPDLLTVYPFGGGGGTLHGTGVPEVAVCEYLEEHPLGRAEWIRFFGVLLGREREADSLYEGIKARYEALCADSTAVPRPRVLFGSVWNGQWWVPPGNSHMARLIADAGGAYVFAHRTGRDNIAVDMETLVAMGDSIDHWGMIADIAGNPSPSDFTNDDLRMTALKAVRTNRLFVGNTRTADLFGQALLEPDRVLQDLRACLWDEPDPARYSGRVPSFIPVYPAPGPPPSASPRMP